MEEQGECKEEDQKHEPLHSITDYAEENGDGERTDEAVQKW